MSNLKLGVDVIGAHNLLPKDGQGSSIAFVELSFDGLKQRTTVKEKQLNPIWNESFYFNISDRSDLQYLTLDAYVYSRVGATSSKSSSRTRSCLGKVSLPGSSFVQDYSNAVVLHCRLEKHRTFSRVTGDLGLKVYITNDPSILVSVPIAAVDPPANATILALAGTQEDSSSLTPKEVGESLTSHDSRNQSPDQGVNTAIATVESLVSDTTPLSQGDSNLPVVNNSSTIPNAEIGSVHTSPDHGDNASTSSKYSSVSDNASTSSKYSSVADNASTYGEYSESAEIRSLAIANKDTTLARGGTNRPTSTVEAGVGTRHTFINHPIASHDPGDKEESTSVPVGLMHFLYVRIVKARNLPVNDVLGDISPFVEATIGKHKGSTKHLDKEKNPVWDQVFSFARFQLQAFALEIVIKDRDENCVVGSLLFDLNEISSSPPDSDTASSLAPQWYRLQDKRGNTMQGELMLSVWLGTQTDDAFSDAGNSDAASVIDSTPLASTVRGPNHYFAPTLWYVRVTVVQVEDLHFANENRLPDAYVKVSIGNQVSSTKTIQSRKRTLVWNEDLLFVTAEPFDKHLLFTFVDHAGPDKEKVVGRVVITLLSVERRSDNRICRTRSYRIENHEQIGQVSSRFHARICLEGGYCVSYGSPLYNCDLRPTAKQLWRPAIGIVELEIMDGEGLHPMKTSDGRGTTDSYCVAKYGRKWVRTRIHFDNLCPKYNETHSWEVYDPATVLTVCVFHCSQLGQQNSSNGGKDLEMGKIRIRISTLEPGRRYTRSYPLLVVQPNGVNKMGELNLTIQFSCTSLLNMLSLYSQPLMPKMHYSLPIHFKQRDILNAEAINLVAERFSKAEPPLKKEVVAYMSDGESCFWSMRRSKATFFRVTMVLSGLFHVAEWYKDIYMWKNPIMTVLAHALLLVLVTSPGLILPATFLYLFLTGIWNFCFQPRDHPLIDTKLTQAEVVDRDEFEEELDTFPTSQSRKVLTKRYDRLRSIAYRLQKVVGDVASAGERIQMLLSWRDSSATAIFLTFCLLVAVVLYVTPFEVVAGLALFVMMMPGRLRYRLQSVLAPLVNFFTRLPDRTDILL